MRKEEEPRESGYLTRLSLQKLGAYAIQEELIEGIEIREDRVVIVQGDNRFVLPPDRASTFLVGMLRGRSWFLDPEEPLTIHAPEEPAPYRGGVQGHGSKTPTSDIDYTVERTLDSLLSFAMEAGIIDGYEKDAAAQTVKIEVPACSTTLSYPDTLAYLLDCIQYELRARGHERRR